MRIISGKYKSRRIDVPHNITARPTTDFAKEGLFNLLNNQIDFEDIDVLDLFAGTGSLSLEFISRGARNVVSVKKNEIQSCFIRNTYKMLNIDNLMLIKGDVFRYLETCRMKFDVIFADPPYELPHLTGIPDLIFKHNLLKEDGLFILEHSAKNSFENHPNFSHHRHYGNVNFTFFQSPTP